MPVITPPVAVDNETIERNSQGKLAAPDVTTLNLEVAEQQIDIIELQANAAVTPFDHDTLIIDTFSDSTGYNDSVNTGNTTATFSTNKYRRVNPSPAYTNMPHYYPFDSNFADNSGSANGTAQGNTAISATQSKFGGNSASGDGNGDGVLWTSGVTTSGEYMFSAWFYKNAGTAKKQIFNIDDGAVQVFTNAGNLTLTTTTGSLNETYSVGTSLDGGWHHIVLTYDGSTSKVYLDGVERISGTGGQHVGSKMGIGLDTRIATYPTQSWDGYMDDFSTWNEVSTSIISSLYNSGTGTAADDVATSASSVPQIVEIDLPTISGTVTDVMLVCNCPERESGDDVYFNLIDASAGEDSDIALDTKFSLVNADGTDLSGGKIQIELAAKSTNPTTGYPSVRSYCLKLWKE